MIHLSQITNKPKTIKYWRNPTKEEIKFGYGALHYREFNFENCFDAYGNLKLRIKASDDGLIYYNAGIEYHTTSKSKLQKIVI